jgi:hypothetical protein
VHLTEYIVACPHDDCEWDWDFVAIVERPAGVDFETGFWNNVWEVDNIDGKLFAERQAPR